MHVKRIYEILNNPLDRADYDRKRVQQNSQPRHETPKPESHQSSSHKPESVVENKETAKKDRRTIIWIVVVAGILLLAIVMRLLGIDPNFISFK